MNAHAIDQPVPRPAVREDLGLSAALGLAGAFAALALVPYLQQTMPEVLAKVPFPLPILLALQSVQAFVLIGLMSFCGLRMGHATGMGAPWLRSLLFRRPRKTQPWLLAFACGLAVSAAIVALDPLFLAHFPPPLHAVPASDAHAQAFAGFLASFYGGIVEEVELRLFFATLLAWLLLLLAGHRRLRWHAWFAVIAAALVFGAGHLPAAANIWPLDAVVVSRTLLLNGVAGLVFGWFYVRHGLESAMLSHFAADLVLHVLAPLAMA